MNQLSNEDIDIINSASSPVIRLSNNEEVYLKFSNSYNLNIGSLQQEFNILEYLHRNKLSAIIPNIVHFIPQQVLAVQYFSPQVYLPLSNYESSTNTLKFQLFTQICNYLNEIHATAVIHADLKPEHILVNKNNPIDIKIIDWNLSFNTNSQAFTKSFELSKAEFGRFMGSLNYAAVPIHLGYLPTLLTDIESLIYIMLELSDYSAEVTWIHSVSNLLAEAKQFETSDLMAAVTILLDKESNSNVPSHNMDVDLAEKTNDDVTITNPQAEIQAILKAKQQFSLNCTLREVKESLTKLHNSIHFSIADQQKVCKSIYSLLISVIFRVT